VWVNLLLARIREEDISCENLNIAQSGHKKAPHKSTWSRTTKMKLFPARVAPILPHQEPKIAAESSPSKT
jgi:hypothetical protein